MSNMIERVTKNMIRFWYLGFAFYMLVSAIVGMLSIIGLASWQHNYPHELDHNFFNFDFYWGVVNAYQIMQFVIMAIGIFFIIKNFRTKWKIDEVKK